MAADDVFTVVFGSRARAVLEAMFLRLDNDNSHVYTTFLLHDGAVAGMLHAYPAAAAERQAGRTGWLYLRFARWQLPRALLSGLWMSSLLDFVGGNLEREDCYIAMLALYPGFRGRGYSRALLVEAQRRARQCGCTRLKLDVDERNRVARAAYAAAGFQQIDASKEVRLDGERFRLLRLAKPVEAGG